MEDLITPERAKAFLKQNKIVDAGGLEAALLQGAKILVQEMLRAELDQELGYQKYDIKSKQTDNTRNGHSKKSINSVFGKMSLGIPRDKNGEFEPTIVGKHERQLSNSIERIVLALYAKGMSMEDISSYLETTHGVTLSHETISSLTDRILPLAIRWQNRPLEVLYPILYLDGVVFSVNQDGVIVKKTAYVVYGITIKGMKEILGIWVGEAESSKFWMRVLMEIRNRGVKDVFIVCVDGLNGFINAIEAVFQKAEVTEVHRAPNQNLDQICELQGHQGILRGHEAYLPRT